MDVTAKNASAGTRALRTGNLESVPFAGSSIEPRGCERAAIRLVRACKDMVFLRLVMGTLRVPGRCTMER